MCAKFYSNHFLCGIVIPNFYLFLTHIILFSLFPILWANSLKYFISTKIKHINKRTIIKKFFLKFKTTLHQKFYALIEIYRPPGHSYHYNAFFLRQYVGAVQHDDVAQVVFPIQMQAHSKMKKTPHRSQPPEVYTTSPIRLEISRIRKHQLITKGYNQTVELYHKMSQVTPSMTKDEMHSRSVKKFPSESKLSKYPCIGSMTDDKSTLVISNLLDPSETSSNLGESRPKQRQHNLKMFQLYSLRDNSGHEESKKPCLPQLVQHPIRLDTHA